MFLNQVKYANGSQKQSIVRGSAKNHDLHVVRFLKRSMRSQLELLLLRLPSRIAASVGTLTERLAAPEKTGM